MMRRTKYSRSSATIVLILGVTASIAFPDSWRAPSDKEHWSSDRAFVLRVSPGSKAGEHPGNCLGELNRCKGSEQSLVWRRHLVNDEAPVAVLIANSGKYVVTMDEWEQFGDLPLVIYGRRGNLIAIPNLESIVNPYEGRYDGISRMPEGGTSGPNWRKHSLIFFGPDDETLFIRLSSGALRVVRLSDGRIMTDGWHKEQVKRRIQPSGVNWESLKEFGKARIAQLAVEYLGSPSCADRETGAIIVGELKIREAIPRIRALLTDDAAYLTGIGGVKELRKIYFVRRAAARALRAMGEEATGIVIEEPASDAKHQSKKGVRSEGRESKPRPR